jgi:hypothetical protein
MLENFIHHEFLLHFFTPWLITSGSRLKYSAIALNWGPANFLPKYAATARPHVFVFQIEIARIAKLQTLHQFRKGCFTGLE